MDLEKLLVLLINEQGLTEEEALEVAAARVRAHRSAIQKSNSGAQGAPLASVQDDGRGVNYGDETPAQAKERWLAQERNDPQGVYSPGGSSGGGIFGGGTIPMEDYDPDAVNRSVGAISQIKQLQIQQQMLMELKAMREQRQLEPPKEPPRRQLDDRRGSEGRQLGKKRRD
jgi:hypothetical protein